MKLLDEHAGCRWGGPAATLGCFRFRRRCACRRCRTRHARVSAAIPSLTAESVRNTRARRLQTVTSAPEWRDFADERPAGRIRPRRPGCRGARRLRWDGRRVAISVIRIPHAKPREPTIRRRPRRRSPRGADARAPRAPRAACHRRARTRRNGSGARSSAGDKVRQKSRARSWGRRASPTRRSPDSQLFADDAVEELACSGTRNGAIAASSSSTEPRQRRVSKMVQSIAAMTAGTRHARPSTPRASAGMAPDGAALIASSRTRRRTPTGSESAIRRCSAEQERPVRVLVVRDVPPDRRGDDRRHRGLAIRRRLRDRRLERDERRVRRTCRSSTATALRGTPAAALLAGEPETPLAAVTRDPTPARRAPSDRRRDRHDDRVTRTIETELGSRPGGKDRRRCARSRRAAQEPRLRTT